MLNPNLASKISYERILINFQNEAVNRNGVLEEYLAYNCLSENKAENETKPANEWNLTQKHGVSKSNKSTFEYLQLSNHYQIPIN